MLTTLIVLSFFLQAAQLSQAGRYPAEQKRLPAAQINPTFGKLGPERWNRVHSDPVSTFNTAPNAFMTEVVRGLKPGRTLDIGMGQGRNSIYLAKLSWDVTEFDISERGMELAQKSAEIRALMKTKTAPQFLEADLSPGAPGGSRASSRKDCAGLRSTHVPMPSSSRPPQIKLPISETL